MRRGAVVLALWAIAGCGHASPGLGRRPARSEVGSPPPLRALADTLIALAAEDQAERANFAGARIANDTAFLFRLARADSARTTRLRAIVRAHGWPSRALVGDSAASAAWLILQHSPVVEFQSEVLPSLEEAARRGDVRRSEVALLTDRVRVRRGEPQLYGSSFQVVDGRLVADPIADIRQLDARRAAAGLPPMAEYVRKLEEVYRMPVVWPPR